MLLPDPEEAEQDENADVSNIEVDDTRSEMSLGCKSFSSVNSTSTSIMGGSSVMINKYRPNLRDDDEDDEGMTNIFKITPSKITLQPNTAVDFQVTSKSLEEGVITEIWECSVLIGKARKPSTIFTPEITCNFLKPLIDFSSKKVYFEYLYEENVLIKPITKQLKLKNISLLTLVFMIKCPMPFSVDRLEYTLNPEEETTVNVSFDPGMKTDRLCYRPKAKLSIIYRDHVQRDKIPLYAECWFPNLEFPSTEINFDCILNNTKCLKHVQVKNVSKVPVEFSWVFLQDEFEDVDPITIPVQLRHFWVKENIKAKKAKERRSSTMPMRSRRASVAVGKPRRNSAVDPSRSTDSLVEMTKQYNMNDLFDIRPLHGIVAPGESTEMSFVFHGVPNLTAFGTALCEVVGGPDYKIQFNASSNNIRYSISTKEIEFGTIMMGNTVADEVIISNDSGVPFDFHLDLDALQHPQFLQFTPMSGKVAGYSDVKISIKCTPLLPMQYREEFNIQIAYFEPENITLSLDALCSEIIVELPRDIPPEVKETVGYKKLFNSATLNIKQHLQDIQDKYRQRQMELLTTPSSSLNTTEEVEQTTQQMSQSVDSNGRPKSRRLSMLEMDPQIVDREMDKLQFVDVLSHLLHNHWKSGKSKKDSKSSKIAFSNKDLKIGYERSALVRLLHDFKGLKLKPKHSSKLKSVQCDFAIYQYRAVGSIRYRPFELMGGYYVLSFGNVVHSMPYSKTFTLRNHDLFHYFRNKVFGQLV